MEKLKRWKFKEGADYPSEWTTLINQLDSFRHDISYMRYSEFYDGIAVLQIEGIGKERDKLSVWSETIDFIERVLHKYYGKYIYYSVNHQAGLRIDIKRK